VTLPLSALLGALANEFARADTAAELYRAHTQNVYRQSELLADLEPSRIRIREATISLPLVLDELSELEVRDYGLTPEQCANLLPEQLGRAQRAALGRELHALLVRQGKNRLLSDTLEEDLRAAARELLERMRLPVEIDVAPIKDLRRAFLEQPREERELRFEFRTEKVANVERDRVVLLEVKLELG
jgi:hypothetical protein